MTQQTRQLPKLYTRAAFVPATFNDTDRTVELTWSTGAAVRRVDWWTDEQFYEQLSMAPDSVRLERLNAGAPLLPNHNSYDLKGVLGVVERAWCNGQQKPDTFLGNLAVKFPLKFQRGFIAQCRMRTSAVIKSEIINNA
ncbi:hypothetical protein KFZ76_07260 [Methylovulum psychrotolerans]|uniref:hypothetical protein n=1 Tax=Methylovulum psychrotolerans TaxID=1704499 RepID=UPI001BFF2EFD|nr:hypothetical protein [Methylovulum psychrotolerans]MBT9097509.1 hypothetical protein [Methylovulum psychrotolerans]